jgi:hypothetical protein
MSKILGIFGFSLFQINLWDETDSAQWCSYSGREILDAKTFLGTKCVKNEPFNAKSLSSPGLAMSQSELSLF